MTAFATLPVTERRLLIEQVAARLGVVPVIIEKDFWVCWILARIFVEPAIASHVVFKGGTTLSKVFGVIDRFSEDIDLCVLPARLDTVEASIDEANSANQRRKGMSLLAARCEAYVRDELRKDLGDSIGRVLGPAPSSEPWLTFEMDSAAGSSNLWFNYPSVLPQPGGYVAKRVKLEIGSITRQQPTGSYPISPMLTGTLGAEYDDFAIQVVSLELGRTFWEKATILHAEFHRPAEKPIRDRYSRHYADFAALWRHESRAGSLNRRDLLEDVVLHKSRYFDSSWANYETARAGSFKLAPPAFRLAALARDYEEMRPMFLSDPPSFDEVIKELAAAERALNEDDSVLLTAK